MGDMNVTSLYAATDQGGTMTSSVITPPADCMLLVACKSNLNGTFVVTTTLNNVSSWTEVSRVDSVNERTSILYAYVSGSPGSGTITVSGYGGTGSQRACLQIAAIAGAGSVVQTKTGLSSGTSTSISLTLDLVPRATSMVVAAVGPNGAPSATPGTSFYEIAETGSLRMLQLQYDTVNATGLVDWTLSSAFATQQVALEIAPKTSRYTSFFDPRTAIGWSIACWASDPSWKNKPSDGQRVSTIRNAGSLSSDFGRRLGNTSNPIYNSSVAAYNNRATISALAGVGGEALSVPAYTAISTPYTMVLIGNSTASAVVMASSHTNGSTQVVFFKQAGWSFDAGAPTAIFGGTEDSNPHLIVGYASTTGRVLVDGVIVGSGNTGSASCTTATLFGLPAGGNINYDMTGQIAFFGIYAGDITQHPQWGNFKQWVRSYYGINVARSSV